MKDFISKNITFLGIVGITLVILIGGVFLFSKNPQSENSTKNISRSILVSEDSQKSNPEAQLTLVEFGDYQCPACAAYHSLVKQLLADFPGKINFVFRNFPLPLHKNAPMSSYAAEAAGLQGKFWEMHDKIYETQSEWSDLANPKDKFAEYAVGLGLNKEKFLKDIDGGTVKDIVKRGLSDGALAGITATPTFFLDGVQIPLVANYAEFKKLVEDKLNSK